MSSKISTSSSAKLFTDLTTAQLRVVLRGCELTRHQMAQLKTHEDLLKSLKTWMEAYQFVPEAHLFGTPPRRPVSGCSCCPDSVNPLQGKTLRRTTAQANAKITLGKENAQFGAGGSKLNPASIDSSQPQTSATTLINRYQLKDDKANDQSKKIEKKTPMTAGENYPQPKTLPQQPQTSTSDYISAKAVATPYSENIFLSWCQKAGLAAQIGQAIADTGLESVEQLKSFADLAPRGLQVAFGLKSVALGFLLKKKLDPYWVPTIEEDESKETEEGTGTSPPEACPSKPLAEAPIKNQDLSSSGKQPISTQQKMEATSTRRELPEFPKSFNDQLQLVANKILEIDGYLVECQIRDCMQGKFMKVRKDILPERLRSHLIWHGLPENKRKSVGGAEKEDLPEKKMLSWLKRCYPLPYLDRCAEEHAKSLAVKEPFPPPVSNVQKKILISNKGTLPANSNIVQQGGTTSIVTKSMGKTVKIVKNKVICQTAGSTNLTAIKTKSSPPIFASNTQIRSASAIPSNWKNPNDQTNLISQAMQFSQVTSPKTKQQLKLNTVGGNTISQRGAAPTTLKTWQPKPLTKVGIVKFGTLGTSKSSGPVPKNIPGGHTSIRDTAIASLSRTRSQPDISGDKVRKTNISNAPKRKSTEATGITVSIPAKKTLITPTVVSNSLQSQRISSRNPTSMGSRISGRIVFPPSNQSEGQPERPATVIHTYNIQNDTSNWNDKNSTALETTSESSGCGFSPEDGETAGRRRSSRPKPPQIQRYGVPISDTTPKATTKKSMVPIEHKNGDQKSSEPPKLEVQPQGERYSSEEGSEEDVETISSYWELLTTISTLALQEGTSKGILKCQCGIAFNNHSDVGDMDEHILSHVDAKTFSYIMKSGPIENPRPKGPELKAELVFDFKTCFPQAYEKIKDAIGIAPQENWNRRSKRIEKRKSAESGSPKSGEGGKESSPKSDLELQEESLAAWLTIAGEDKKENKKENEFSPPAGGAPKKKSKATPEAKTLEKKESPKPLKYFELMAGTIENIRKQVRQWTDVFCILRTCSHTFRGSAGSVEVTQYHLENHIEDHAWHKLKIYGCSVCTFRSSGKLQMEYHLTTRHRRACKDVKDLKTLMNDHRGDFENELMRIARTCYPTLISDKSIVPYDPKSLEIEERDEEFEE